MSEPDQRAGFLAATVAVAFAAYAPYAWLVMAARPWDDDRLVWIRMWPLLPGLLPRALWFHGSSDLVANCAMAAFTLALLAPFVVWAERSSRSLWASFVTVALLSCLNSWGAWHAFRA